MSATSNLTPHFSSDFAMNYAVQKSLVEPIMVIAGALFLILSL